MRSFGRRAWFLIGLGLIAIPVAGGALAYACTGLATISVSPGTAAVGSTVTVNGKGFAAHDPSDARTEPAKIRLDDVDGPVLATASPTNAAGGGSFSVPLEIPAVAPGTHIVIVTQNGTDGRPAYGTPARQALTVVGAPAARGSASGAAPVATTLSSEALATLSMASARTLARERIKRSQPRAKRIRVSCRRRTRTSAKCKARYRVGSKTRRKSLVVQSASSSSVGW